MTQQIKRFILKRWYKLIGKTPADMPMVKYWRKAQQAEAKIIHNPDGGVKMIIDGEDEEFPTFPRGHILLGIDGYTQFSKLKHIIKNKVFNESWDMLHKGASEQEIAQHIKNALYGEVAVEADKLKMDMLPPKSMCRAVKEIHRAWTKVAPERTYPIRDYLCFILQEDDGYRFRVQWLVKYFRPSWFKDPVRIFEKALQVLEHAEVVGDMKERIRLLRTILLVALKDKSIRELFNKLVKEIDWKKVLISKSELYHFRGKYFKADYDLFEY